MIDRYLEKGTMYVFDDNGVKAEMSSPMRAMGILEIKNIATVPEYQGNGYAKNQLILLLKSMPINIPFYRSEPATASIAPFYEKGLVLRSHIIPNFLQTITTTRYLNVWRHTDMVIFQKKPIN